MSGRHRKPTTSSVSVAKDRLYRRGTWWRQHRPGRPGSRGHRRRMGSSSQLRVRRQLGESTPATVTTAACSSPQAPGHHTAAASSPRRPNWPPRNSRSPSLSGCWRPRAVAPGRCVVTAVGPKPARGPSAPRRSAGRAAGCARPQRRARAPGPATVATRLPQPHPPPVARRAPVQLGRHGRTHASRRTPCRRHPPATGRWRRPHTPRRPRLRTPCSAPADAVPPAPPPTDVRRALPRTPSRRAGRPAPLPERRPRGAPAGLDRRLHASNCGRRSGRRTSAETTRWTRSHSPAADAGSRSEAALRPSPPILRFHRRRTGASTPVAAL